VSRFNLSALIDPRAITYNELVELWAYFAARKPVVYYGATEYVTRGEMYEIEGGMDKLIVIHPDDLELLCARHPYIRFVPLRDKPADLAKVKQFLQARLNAQGEVA